MKNLKAMRLLLWIVIITLRLQDSCPLPDNWRPKPHPMASDDQQFTEGGVYEEEVTETLDPNSTAINMQAERTTIPEKDIDEALNPDFGRYTPMNFQYYNEQFVQLDSRIQQSDECANQWLKCLNTITNVQVICVLNSDKHNEEGVTDYRNYCDMQHDNCRHNNRYWRIVDIGYCDANKKYHVLFTTFIPDRRRMNHIWNLLKVLKPKSSLKD